MAENNSFAGYLDAKALCMAAFAAPRIYCRGGR